MGKWRDAPPSDMDEQRRLLDELMGNERNLNEEEKQHKKRHFTDSDVCKYYLCGVSPYALFKNTKSDMGPYDKVFDDDCRDEWERLPQAEKDKYGYEYELMVFLERLVSQCEQRVKRHNERIKQEQDNELDAGANALSEGELRRIAELDIEMPAAEAEAQRLGEEGKIEDAMYSMQRADTLRRELAAIESKAAQMAREQIGRKAMIVCEVSGNFMNSTDNGDRLRCHFEGKQYQGWKMIRERLAELKAQNPPPPPSGRRDRLERRPDDRRDRDRDRRPRDRESDDRRDRDRGRDRRSERSRSRDRYDRRRDYDDRRGDRRDRDRYGGDRRRRSRSRSRSRDRRRR